MPIQEPADTSGNCASYKSSAIADSTSTAAAKCSKTNEEIAAIIAEKDREIERIRLNKELLESKLNLQDGLIKKELLESKLNHQDGLNELKALIIENGTKLHEEFQTVKKTQEQFIQAIMVRYRDQVRVLNEKLNTSEARCKELEAEKALWEQGNTCSERGGKRKNKYTLQQ